MISKTTFIFSNLCLAVAAGCSVEAPEGAFEDQVDVGVEDFSTGDVAVDALSFSGPGAGTMTGTWALAHLGSSCILGQQQLTRALYKVTITQTGDLIAESRSICALDLSAILNLTPIVPTAVQRTIAFPEIDNGYVTGLQPGAAYVSSTELGLWGLNLENPETDPLPTEPDDPTAVDADEDGLPGVTLLFKESECARYVTQRQRISYQGTFINPNRIEGESANKTELSVLDSTAAICGVNPRLDANDRNSSFVLVRVDGAGGAPNLDTNDDGEIDCDEIAPLNDVLIAPREPDNDACTLF